MRKITIGLVIAAVILALLAVPVMAKGGDSGVTIQDGLLTYSPSHYLHGQPLKVGYDIYGYNYQAHMFSGSYANIYLGGEGFPPYEGDTAAYLAQYPAAKFKWYWPYRDDQVIMKWNDAWISNKDCNGDGKLDRPSDNGGSYIGSGAWETNHQSGSEGGDDGKVRRWTYFGERESVPAYAK